MRFDWLDRNIKIDLTGANGSRLTCRVCESALDIKTKGNFSPYSIMVGIGTEKARTKHIKTQKEALNYFYEQHWESCEKTHDEYFERQIKALSKT